MSAAGTTTSRAIPALLAARAVALPTSSSRDVVEATAVARSALGDVRVFDAQAILGEDAAWRTLA
ncbi:MAG: hypothetical protein QOJ63_846 [Solirubrobacteraceae bacterium]|jgi:hypothetical protein|nr:hypothetical protein [Solirubrobacteraceae bacterium]